jgi:hypothetical protein
VDKATINRARKVAAIVDNPGRPGEALAAWERLGEMASARDTTRAAFLEACGLNYATLAARAEHWQAHRKAA